MFRAVTKNISDHALRRPERNRDFTDELKTINPDIVFIQEAIPDQTQNTAEELGTDYSVHYASSYGENHPSGLAIITHFPLIETDKSLFGSKIGMQRASFDIGEQQPLTVINLHHQILNEIAKICKARAITRSNVAGPLIVAGDHNAFSWFPSVRHLRRSMDSAHRYINDGEQLKTYPTTFADELMQQPDAKLHEIVFHGILKNLSSRLGRSEANRLGYAVDHIHVSKLSITRASIFGGGDGNGNRPSSDHYGLVADLNP